MTKTAFVNHYVQHIVTPQYFNSGPYLALPELPVNFALALFFERPNKFSLDCIFMQWHHSQSTAVTSLVSSEPLLPQSTIPPVFYPNACLGRRKMAFGSVD